MRAAKQDPPQKKGGFFVFTSQNLLITVYNISGRGCSNAGDGIPERARARAENPPILIYAGRW